MFSHIVNNLKINNGVLFKIPLEGKSVHKFQPEKCLRDKAYTIITM
jgi:hypothetical protein